MIRTEKIIFAESPMDDVYSRSDRPSTGATRKKTAMIDFPLKLAVASKENKAISEHFGHAKQFLIYEAAPERLDLLETRIVAHYCLGQHSDQTAMSGILEALKDCYAVFVAKIGDGPTEKLNAIGVRAVSRYAYEAIEVSLLDYMHRVAAGEEGI